MTTPDQQFTSMLFEQVPHNNWQTVIFKTPLYVWRLGLHFLLPSNFACITTEGRKSGLPRHTMVEYSKLKNKYYIASGWADQPHWVKNLIHNPVVTLQPVRSKPIAGQAQRIQDDATLSATFQAMQQSPVWEPWLASLNIEPTVEDFVANKQRLYIFEVTPTETDLTLPPLDHDLRWIVWVFLLVAVIAGRPVKRPTRSK